MLAVAAELAPSVEWKQGTAETLPVADSSVDAVVSQFGMMFFTDRQGAIREMLRVLTPGGSLAVAVWDSLDHAPAYSIEVNILERIAGPSAANALRAPFVMGDRRALKTLFGDAGVPSPEVATQTVTARFPSVRVMIEADLRGWLPVMGVMLAERQIDHILTEAEEELGPFIREDGQVVFDSPAHIVTGNKPG